ncbi:hypothetical protein D9757_009543 [Collybiopsis confluens]|uniref:Uncharacterized protein n=1 Tax=Collybiopsis confluens TaxID=2823264 RepID=A0A8H5H8K1_9AGAR|nr:hypothetical protein D9757_009543 [Collybiopsis confluens]
MLFYHLFSSFQILSSESSAQDPGASSFTSSSSQTPSFTSSSLKTSSSATSGSSRTSSGFTSGSSQTSSFTSGPSQHSETTAFQTSTSSQILSSTQNLKTSSSSSAFPQSSDPHLTPSSHKHTAAIIGSVIGVVIVLIVGMLWLVVLNIRRKRRGAVPQDIGVTGVIPFEYSEPTQAQPSESTGERKASKLGSADTQAVVAATVPSSKWNPSLLPGDILNLEVAREEVETPAIDASQRRTVDFRRHQDSGIRVASAVHSQSGRNVGDNHNGPNQLQVIDLPPEYSPS